MKEISSGIKSLIRKYKDWYHQINEEIKEPTIEVDEVASKVAFFYEKVREIVDWKEEHLLRRAAIERILKRRLMFGEDEKMALPLITELVRGGHLPNRRIPEKKSEEIKEIIKKYLYILKKISLNKKESVVFFNWLISIMAVEIEDSLMPPLREKALIEYMTEVMYQRIKIDPRWLKIDPTAEEKKKIFIFLACQKSLFNLDEATITYYLLEKLYSWRKLDSNQLEKISNQILTIKKKIERLIKHPLEEKILLLCEKYDTPFLLIHDILSSNPNQIEEKLKNPQVTENLIKEAYQIRYQKLVNSLKRAGVYATLSIFLSKMAIAFAIEIPLDKYFLHQFSYQTLGVNILAPPLLMAFLILSIQPPRRSNFQKVLIEVMKLIYTNSKRDTYLVQKPFKIGVVLGVIILAFYAFSFIFSFGLISWILMKKLHFSIFSTLVFLIFISLISFAGIKLRQRAKELTVEEEKDSFLQTILDIFSLPILRVGRWLSYQWQKHNFLSAVFNALIDMPFQTFIEFLEQLRYFIKEKKEEIK